MRVQPTVSKPLLCRQVTGLDSAAGLGVIPTGAAYVVFEVEGAAVRWRDDGVDPTATVGVRQLQDAPPYLYDGDLAALKFIQITATAKLNVAFYSFR